MNTSSPKKPWTIWLITLQVVLLGILPILILAYRSGSLDLGKGFLGSALLMLIVAALGALALLVCLYALFAKNTALRNSSLVAVFIGALPVFAILGTVGLAAFSVPPIHDISTDTSRPPLFVSALVERSESDNSIDYNSEKLPDIQAKSYPDIKPLRLSSSPLDTFNKAKKVVEDMGWALQWEDAKTGHIEALVESAVFGFKDDVIIRIEPSASGSVLDMRSASRVGVSDLGANAKRIRAFMDAMQR
ncbi:DUF1499 domain-containing protein [Pseudoteredinibacter isoporae]|uniref:Uncharacterized protein (DUF1499 family) n=1 Tax=Pseudoteredinibacter isoporae TaxID=570281 RepID=A0A7X0JW01_9GAMM|nr:DUF1499 domain-containing protein [Pseudoteredinibacter isoporae]MBB6523280.1 uncharacterized protein (DUF1499 family) [Pseudoteredinibacter isoporae]NHO88794.1 DUF1499 domain-containing protein [Pseudoteredinibacter isoporae]NIB24498.1 DUF1499 domain-containing protein [Pseudoteredinibacter isoporae]